MSGRGRDPKISQGKKPLSHGWIVVPSKTYPDRVYFYNTVTKCSTWNNPCEDADDSEGSSISVEKVWSAKAKQKSLKASQLRKCKSNIISHHLDQNQNTRVNKDIEDYDDHDQYFANIPSYAFSLSDSHILSPSSSPVSDSSSKTEISDSDRNSDSNTLLENNKKQLWVHFLSSPEKSNMKKSVALSDFQEPSTSQNSATEKINYSPKNNSVLTRDNGQSFFESAKNHASDFETRKNKKKKKPKNSFSKKNSVMDKTIKNVVFKKRDKTPAQTRLLNLRKQNTEKLKEMSAKYPGLATPTSNKEIPKKVKNSSIFDLEEQNEKDGSLKVLFTPTGTVTGLGSHGLADFTEEMDWEPSNEESDVMNINVFRQQWDKPSETSSNVFFDADPSFTLPFSSHSWFLILDTNIFVSCLNFIKELRDTKVADLGYPVIYVPWRVLQELDHLKDTKIHVNVRRAIAYLNENFKSRHPRIFGQSLEDFMKMVDFETSAPDDEILQTCLQLQKQHPDKKLMLLTNDKNLESKAIVSNVETYSKDSFQKKFLKCKIPHASALNKSNNGGRRADDCLCEGKAILKDFISSVVETEMKIAFEGDWIKLAVKKPPWSLRDALDCLLKHWRSIFFLNFSKETQNEAELLYERLFKREAVSTKDVADIITSIQRLVASIDKSQKEKRPYLDLIPATLSKLSDLLRMLSPNDCLEADLRLSSPLASSKVPVQDSNLDSAQVCQSSTNEVSKIKSLFKDIWDFLRSFCCSISDVLQSSSADNEAIIEELRLKLSLVLNEVEELVSTIEKILTIDSAAVSEGHPVIMYFSGFLIHVYPSMTQDLKNELPKCLAAFFKDFEGRSLLSCSLIDFKEFIQDLSKASDYFNARSTCGVAL